MRDGALTVGDRRRVAPAVLGLPFLAAGLGMWGLIVPLVASHARAGSLGAPGGYAPMVAILLVCGAPFVWVGARLTLHNHRVRIRRLESTVDDIDDYVVFRRVRTRRLAEFAAVALQTNVRVGRSSNAGSVSTTSRSHTALSVELRPGDTGTRSLRLAFDYEPGAIRALGAAVAGYTGLPLLDELATVRYE